MAPGLVNYALYQAGWLCCVLAAAADHPWWGMLGGGVLVGVHLLLLPRPVGELKLLVFAGLLGALMDSLQSCAGLLIFRSGYVVGCLAPPWIVVMWMQFATLFRFGFSFLLGRYGLGALLAAAGGPLAFWVGSRLGAVEFPPPMIRSLIVLGVVWAGAVPLLSWFAGKQITADTLGRYRGLGSKRRRRSGP